MCQPFPYKLEPKLQPKSRSKQQNVELIGCNNVDVNYSLVEDENEFDPSQQDFLYYRDYHGFQPDEKFLFDSQTPAEILQKDGKFLYAENDGYLEDKFTPKNDFFVDGNYCINQELQADDHFSNYYSTTLLMVPISMN